MANYQWQQVTLVKSIFVIEQIKFAWARASSAIKVNENTHDGNCFLNLVSNERNYSNESNDWRLIPIIILYEYIILIQSNPEFLHIYPGVPNIVNNLYTSLSSHFRFAGPGRVPVPGGLG